MAEKFVLIEDLFDDLLRAADHEGILVVDSLLELLLRLASATDRHEAVVQMRVVLAKCILAGFSRVEQACRAYREAVRVMSAPPGGFPIGIDGYSEVHRRP